MLLRELSQIMQSNEQNAGFLAQSDEFSYKIIIKMNDLYVGLRKVAGDMQGFRCG